MLLENTRGGRAGREHEADSEDAKGNNITESIGCWLSRR